ncbi:MAG TPA: PASTA domain-containing protein, partial [Gaiellaceae bacterium]|nr:PASTA domain-containing protein [Gaiellaceae bacterium]
RCLVPNVRRRPVRAARRAIGRAGCAVGRIRAVRSRTVPRGRVVAQSVRAGRRVARGTRIALVVSHGR